jgi:hypothetical protein
MTNASTTPAIKHKFEAAPYEARCPYLARVIRASDALPAPADVDEFGSVGGRRVDGTVYLAPGDAILEVEAQHPKKFRGWVHVFVWHDPETGKLLRLWNPGSWVKADLKAAGLPAPLLKGSGPNAAMVRLLHALRLGVADSVKAELEDITPKTAAPAAAPVSTPAPVESASVETVAEVA